MSLDTNIYSWSDNLYGSIKRTFKWKSRDLAIYRGGKSPDIVKNTEKVFSRRELSRKHVIEMSGLSPPPVYIICLRTQFLQNRLQSTWVMNENRGKIVGRTFFWYRKNFSFNGFTTFTTKLQIFLLGTCQDLLHSMPGLFAHMDKTFCIPCQDFVHPLPGLLCPLVYWTWFYVNTITQTVSVYNKIYIFNPQNYKKSSSDSFFVHNSTRQSRLGRFWKNRVRRHISCITPWPWHA
jgi:hypothetical protein